MRVGAILVTLFACSTKQPAPTMAEVTAAMDAFATQMCACKTRTCADDVSASYARWGSELLKTPRPRNERPKDSEAIAAITTKYTECAVKAMLPATDAEAPNQVTPPIPAAP